MDVHKFASGISFFTSLTLVHENKKSQSFPAKEIYSSYNKRWQLRKRSRKVLVFFTSPCICKPLR